MIAIGDAEFELGSMVDMQLRDQLIENARTILTTLRGTLPQNRDLGMISRDIVGKNTIASRGTYMVQAIDQLKKYEPRLEVVEIIFEAKDEKIIPKVVLTYNGN